MSFLTPLRLCLPISPLLSSPHSWFLEQMLMPGNSLLLSFLLSSALFVSSLVPAAPQSGSTDIHKLPDFVFGFFRVCHWAPGADKVSSLCDSCTHVNHDATFIFSEIIQASNFFFVTKGSTEQWGITHSFCSCWSFSPVFLHCCSFI